MSDKTYKRYKTKPECGTRPGYDWHRRDQNEEPCEPCRDAMKAYWKHQRVIRNSDINEKRRIWRQNHPFTYKSNRTRARKLGVNYDYYTEEQVLAIYGLDCHICDKPIDLEAPRQCGKDGWEWGLQIDHVFPLSKGGGDTLDNVRPSHGYCNNIKNATIDYAIKFGGK